MAGHSSKYVGTRSHIKLK